jgi:hypothetical protein
VSLKVFGAPFDRTHENEILHKFIEAAEAHWGNKTDPVTILANISWNNSAVDLVLLKRHAIVIVDFKNYGGVIHMSENGPWRALEREQDVVIRGGGSHANPLMQIKAYRNALIAWFNEHGARLPSKNRPNAGRIGGLVIFHRSCEIDTRRDLAPSVNSWFRVSSFDACIRQLEEFASPDINLTDADLEAIVSHLGASPYVLPGSPTFAAVSADVASDVSQLPSMLQDALHSIDTFLDSEDSVLMVSGMIGTGLPLLIPEIKRQIESRGLTSTISARNARIAAKYGDVAQSLYQTLYKRNPVERDNILVYESLPNNDLENHVYVLADAHLVSDGTQTVGLRKYGTGNILRDFVDVIGLTNTKRKLILFGDPFQLSHGGGNESAMNTTMLEGLCGYPVHEIPLPFLLPNDSANELILIAQSVASAIGGQTFNMLMLPNTELCQRIPEGSLEDTLTSAFSNDPKNTKYVTYTNEDVARVNRFIRESVFKRGALLSAGDIVHVRTAGRRGSGINDQQIAHDSFALVIDVDDNVPAIIQDLKGRTQPIVIPFVRLTVASDSHSLPTSFLCFRNYLYSEKPEELTRDEMVALRVNAEIRWKQHTKRIESGTDVAQERIDFLQRDEHLNAARVRFGYAVTIFSAQSHRFPRIIAHLDKTGHDSTEERAKESYFRYVYTMFTLPTTSMLLHKQRDLHPLALATWRDSSSVAKGAAWDIQRSLSKIRLSVENKHHAALRSAIRQRLDDANIAIVGIDHMNFRERYYLSWKQDFVQIDGIYDGKWLFSSIVAEKSTSAEALAAVREALHLPLAGTFH